VKKIAFLHPPPLYVEIGQGSLKALQENDGVELPLERLPDGRLTAPCREKLTVALKRFLKTKSWQPRARAVCAIGARGVSLRRLSLPAGTKEEFQQRLLLQIEGEFPLPPDELAWGWQQLGETKPLNGMMARQDLLVAAVKKEVVADYHEILRACGTDPVFTLAALARRNLCPQPPDSFAMLDIGNSQSELTLFEKGVPASSRIIFWGGENLSDATKDKLDELTQSINGNLAGRKLFITGQKISEAFTARLASALGNGCQCERLEVAAGGAVAQASRRCLSEAPVSSQSGNSPAGRLCHYECSAAISGLQKFTEQGGEPPLLLRLEQTSGAAASFADLDWKKWGTRIGSLVAALVLLPYAEALLLKPHLAKKVAAFKAEVVRLKVIDRELDFLRYLKSSQPPYLDTLYIFSKSVPPGTKFDALSLNSHGEVSLRCAFHDGQQVADFRTKLIDSGFFTNVTVEEQVPTPDHQRVSVRISAQEKPTAQLLALAVGPTADEIARDGKPAQPGAMPPGISRPAPGVLPAPRKETK